MKGFSEKPFFKKTNIRKQYFLLKNNGSRHEFLKKNFEKEFQNQQKYHFKQVKHQVFICFSAIYSESLREFF